jgi:hypothetical protein
MHLVTKVRFHPGGTAVYAFPYEQRTYENKKGKKN